MKNLKINTQINLMISKIKHKTSFNGKKLEGSSLLFFIKFKGEYQFLFSQRIKSTN